MKKPHMIFKVHENRIETLNTFFNPAILMKFFYKTDCNFHMPVWLSNSVRLTETKQAGLVSRDYVQPLQYNTNSSFSKCHEQ